MLSPCRMMLQSSVRQSLFISKSRDYHTMSTCCRYLPPEELESDYDRWSKLAEEYPNKIDAPILHPIERRPVRPRDFVNPQVEEPHQQIMVSRTWQSRRRSAHASDRTGFYVRLWVAGHNSLATRLHWNEQRSAVGKSGPRTVVPPPVQSRRVSAVQPGQSSYCRRTWV